MSGNQSAYETFQSDWVKTQAWAKSQNIPASSYLPIYQQDASRLVQYGYPMSQAERIQAVRSAAGRGVTQLPQDNPSPTNILGNVKNNASELFNGLNPFHMIPNLFDTAKEAVTHPVQQILDPALDVAELMDPSREQAARQNFSKTILGPHAIGSLVPGAYDLAELGKGKQGIRTLADNPLTAVLDVVPLTKLPLKALSKTDMGAQVAKQAGVSAEELGDLTPGQLSWKLLKNRPTSKLAIQKVATESDPNLVVYKNQTAGDLIRRTLNHFGAGPEQAEINRTISVHEDLGEQEKVALLKPLNDAFSKLDSSQTQQINRYMTYEYHITDNRPDSQILADPKFTPKQSQAMEATFDLDRKLTDIKLNGGDLKVVHTTAGPEIYLVKDGSRGAAVLASKDQFESATNALHAGAVRANEIMDISNDMDAVVGQFFPQIKALSSSVFDSIKASLPDLSKSAVSETLRATLPRGERLDRGSAYLADKKNLENMLGLDERTETVVSRGSKQVAPFSGKFAEWSDGEREAWYQSRDTVLKSHSSEDISEKSGTPGYNAFQTKVRQQAKDRLQLLGQSQEIKVHAPVSAGAARNLSELLSPGGLVDQMKEAYDNQQHDQLASLAKVASNKLHNKSFQSPTRSNVLTQLVGQVDSLAQYSKIRKGLSDELQTIWTGKNAKGKLVASKAKESLSQLVNDRDKASADFFKTSIRNPPSVWDNYRQLEYTRLLMETDAGREMASSTVSQLRNRGVSESTLEALERNPQSIVELTQLSSLQSLENHMLPNVDPGTAKEISDAADKAVYDMRSAGLKPLYLPTLSPFDTIEGTGAELYNISLGRTKVTREQAVYEKSAKITSTIYNFQAGMNKAVHEMVVRNHELTFQEENMPAFLFNRDDLIPIINQHFSDEMAQVAIGEDRQANMSAFYDKKLADMGLMAYDANGIFSITHPKFLNKTMYIDKDLAKVLEKQFDKDNFLTRGYDKITHVFRTSILGYSPRFTAHVVVGGGVMLAAKSDLSMVTNIGSAWKMARTGSVPEDLLSKFNLHEEDPTQLYTKAIGKRSTQEGTGEVILQHAMGHSAAQFTLMERIAQKFGKDAADVKHPEFFSHMLNVIPDANYSLTRFATHLYKSITFLQGLKDAADKGHFYEDVYDTTTESFTRVRHDMTPQQAIHNAMQWTDKVMGDVRTMTPIERNYITRIFPFWGWTKHVLKYVFQYPSDHPYRAMFFSQLSRISLANQNSALPIRTNLLFFLGQPNAQGQVSAIDTRFADPLRDTATYAGLSGWIAGLNPVLTAPFAQVDPSITYGTNVLYPNVTYDSIYGTNDAKAAGSPLTTVESFVPELSTLDSALNLSGQFGYLQSSGNRNAFYKKIFDSLNVPFLQTQSINLRQIAATNEIDRYNQAKTAFGHAWSTGDFGSLKGYGAGPDPRNPDYNITPAELKSVYNSTLKAAQEAGVTPSGITPDLSSPSYS